MDKLSDGHSLAGEPFPGGVRFDKGAQREFDRHFPVGRMIEGEVDDAHAPAAKDPTDLVSVGNPLARRPGTAIGLLRLPRSRRLIWPAAARAHRLGGAHLISPRFYVAVQILPLSRQLGFAP